METACEGCGGASHPLVWTLWAKAGHVGPSLFGRTKSSRGALWAHGISYVLLSSCRHCLCPAPGPSPILPRQAPWSSWSSCSMGSAGSTPALPACLLVSVTALATWGLVVSRLRRMPGLSGKPPTQVQRKVKDLPLPSDPLQALAVARGRGWGYTIRQILVVRHLSQLPVWKAWHFLWGIQWQGRGSWLHLGLITASGVWMLGRLQGHAGDSAGMVFLSPPGRGLADALAELPAFCPNSRSSSSQDSSVLLPCLFSDWKVEVEMAGLLKFHCFGCDAVSCGMSINGSCGRAQPKGGASGWWGGHLVQITYRTEHRDYHHFTILLTHPWVLAPFPHVAHEHHQLRCPGSLWLESGSTQSISSFSWSVTTHRTFMITSISLDGTEDKEFLEVFTFRGHGEGNIIYSAQYAFSQLRN